MSGKRRNKDGLTDKQQQALPIIARAKSRHQGVCECERLGIVSEGQYYQRWVKEPEFVRQLEEERERYFGEVLVRVRDIFVSYAELLAQRLVTFGLQDGRDRLRAIEDVLSAIGIEFGKGSQINVKTNVIQSGGREETLTEAIQRVSRERWRKFEDDPRCPQEVEAESPEEE